MRISDIVVGGVYTNGKAERQVIGIEEDTERYLVYFRYDISYRSTPLAKFARWTKETVKKEH